MKYGCCKNCNCVSKKIKDPGCKCGNHEIGETWIDMGRRITVILDEDALKKLHYIQAKLIRESDKSVSFSRVLNDVLSKALKTKSWIVHYH